MERGRGKGMRETEKEGWGGAGGAYHHPYPDLLAAGFLLHGFV